MGFFQDLLAKLPKNNMTFFGNPIDSAQAKGFVHPLAKPTPTSMPMPTPTPTPTQIPMQTQQPRVNTGMIMNKYGRSKQRTPSTDAFLDEVVLPITRPHGLPDALVAGQFAAEGRTDGLGASRNNFFNLGAFDNDLGNTFRYETPQDGIKAYAELLANDLRYAPHATMSATPEIALQKIGKTFASRPDYAKWITTLPEYRKYR